MLSLAVLPAERRQEAMELVRRVFAAHVAPHFDCTGVEGFLAYTCMEALESRLQRGYLLLAALDGRGSLAGILEIRPPCHVAMLFVDEPCQRSGVGRALLREAVTICRERGGTQLTVNASPNALGAYARMGFLADGPQCCESCGRHTPMSLPLAWADRL